MNFILHLTKSESEQTQAEKIAAESVIQMSSSRFASLVKDLSGLGTVCRITTNSADSTANFEVAGEDGKFYPAKGNHKWYRNTIEVWSDSVPNPVAVRYAYCNYPGEANVRTQLGQALPSFRSDQWEIKGDELR
jgi:hypothetical protein